MSSKEVDGLARYVINEAGYENHFGHGLGHGVGLDIHEDPFLSQASTAEKEYIAANTVLTIEPGVYLPGWGGVRIEDLAYFDDSNIVTISQCPKTPLILPRK